MSWKTRGLCVRMMLLHMLYCWINFEWTTFHCGCFSPTDGPKMKYYIELNLVWNWQEKTATTRKPCILYGSYYINILQDNCRSVACKTAGMVFLAYPISLNVCAMFTSVNTSSSTVGKLWKVHACKEMMFAYIGHLKATCGPFVSTNTETE